MGLKITNGRGATRERKLSKNRHETQGEGKKKGRGEDTKNNIRAYVVKADSMLHTEGPGKKNRGGDWPWRVTNPPGGGSPLAGGSKEEKQGWKEGARRWGRFPILLKTSRDGLVAGGSPE